MKHTIGDVVTKTLSAVITKADNGSFEALVSVFGNVDAAGDMVVAGAFAETLATKFADRPIPVVWSHMSHQLRSFIGKATAAETETGLTIKSEYFDHEDAQLARLLMSEGVIVEFSWSGIILDAAVEQIDGEYVYVIKRVELLEVGPTLAGMNRDTELLGVKSRDDDLRARMLDLVKAEVERATSKAGRVLSQKNVDRLSEAHTMIGDVLASAEPKEDDKSLPAPAEPDPTTPGEQSGQPAEAEPGAFAIARTKARLALSTIRKE